MQQNDLDRHQRTDHPIQCGEGHPVQREKAALAVDTAWQEALQQPLVIVNEAHLATPEYKGLKKAHAREIEDRVEGIEGVYLKVNREIGADFTYNDLLLSQLVQQDGHAFKINIGFGFVLHHIHTGEYRYH